MGRMRIAVLAVTALGAAGSCGCYVPPGTPTPVPFHKRTEPTVGADYYIYVPSYYSDDRRWPLVVTLHGTNPWDTWRKQISAWDSLAEEKGLIVVAPALRSPKGIFPKIRQQWYEDLAEDERRILALLDHLGGRYRIDRRAVLLTGFSAGGYAMYYVGLRNPERFSMLLARACNSDLQMLERIELSDRARRLPIRIFWGKGDFGRIRDESWAAIRYLRNHECFQTKWKKVKGGHIRRPELAYALWKQVLPPEYHR
jgi:predicted peptidase